MHIVLNLLAASFLGECVYVSNHMGAKKVEVAFSSDGTLIAPSRRKQTPPAGASSENNELGLGDRPNQAMLSSVVRKEVENAIKEEGHLPTSDVSDYAQIPALGNFYGASLLINRTKMKMLDHVQSVKKFASFHQNPRSAKRKDEHSQALGKPAETAIALTEAEPMAGPQDNASANGDILPHMNKTTKESRLVQALVAFILIFCILASIVGAMSLRARGSGVIQDNETANEDGGSGSNSSIAPMVEKDFKRVPEGLEEDLYGMGIASLIRDSQRFAMKTELMSLRLARLAISMLVLVFTMTLQVFLLIEMKVLVTSVSTHEARDVYDKYEVHMYGNNPDHMVTTVNGYHRGTDGNFDIAHFADLDDSVKESACQMPLSQPTFFIGILLVWALVCFAEIRRTFDLGISLVWATPTVSSMRESCEDTPESGDEAVLVVGLTKILKATIVFFVLVPRAAVTAVLLWLGCRWLTGTMGFSDVLQNAVTLEFIVLLKDLFYHTMAPHHNKTETRNTLILPWSDKERPSISIFLGGFTWGIMSIVWVLLYVEYFQAVLPDYRWDIHDACASYLSSTGAAGPGT